MVFSLSPLSSEVDVELKDAARCARYQYKVYAQQVYASLNSCNPSQDFLALEETPYRKTLQRQKQRERFQANNQLDVLARDLVEAWLEILYSKIGERFSLKEWLQYKVNSKKVNRLASIVRKARAQRWMKMLDDSAIGNDKAWMSTMTLTEVGTKRNTMAFAHGDGGASVTILKKTLVPLKTHRRKDRPRQSRKVRQVHLFEGELLKVKNSSLSTPLPEPTPVGGMFERNAVHRHK